MTADSGGEQNTSAKKADNNVFDSIKDAVTRGIGLKCEYEEDGQKVQTYIKGNKVYMEGEIETEDKKGMFKGVIKDEKYYFWSDMSTQGMVISLKAIPTDEDTDLSMGETKIYSQDDIINKLEENKDKCSATAIADSMFDIPTDITFTEW